MGSPSDIEQAIMRNSCGIDGLDLSPAPQVCASTKTSTKPYLNNSLLKNLDIQPHDFISIDSGMYLNILLFNHCFLGVMLLRTWKINKKYFYIFHV